MGTTVYENKGSYLYYKDYRNNEEGDSNLAETLKKNHETEGALLAKAEAKARGRAGRFRGKSGARENNKARGGKKAR